MITGSEENFLGKCNEIPNVKEDLVYLQRHSKGYQLIPCLLWSSLCNLYLRLLKRFFGWYSVRIARHPAVTIQICVILIGICSVGFLWFHSEKKAVKLFIPQSSRAIDDLETAEKYFRVDFREEIILLAVSPGHPNALSPKCLRQAFQAHNAVMGIESYSRFCVTLSGNKSKSPNDCMMINPLEFLHFNESKVSSDNIELVLQELNKAYNDTGSLMRNGRPLWLNFNRMFGDANRKQGSITSAKALQMIYLLRDPKEDDATENILQWEKTFVDKLASLADKLSCFKVHYSSERSMDDAIGESTGSDISLVSVTFGLMISFACIMLGKFLNPLTGHSLLANAGVFAVALGISAGLGLGMWFRVPFLSIVGIVPFLVLGIGIDDMFIMVDELDRQPVELSTTEKIKAVMKHSGATVTMTTMTDLVAFAVSTSSSFPAIRYFCTYAALTVTASFLMVVTFFVAIMTYDVRRIKSGRRDCIPFLSAPSPKEGMPAWEKPHLQNSNRVMKYWATFLMLPVTKVMVTVLSLSLLAAGIYGVTQVEESFDRRILAKDDSHLKQFLTAQNKYFRGGMEVNLVETGKVDYKLNSTQESIKQLTNILIENEYYQDRSLSWMDTFSQYAKMSKKNITGSGFLRELKQFLQIPTFSYHKQDLRLSEDGKKIEASRIIGFMKSSSSSTFHKNAMLTLREDIEKKTNLDAFPIVRYFIFFEMYAIVTKETIRNLIISALAVFIVTSPFLVDCTVTLLVVLNFTALVCELFGLMVIWDVALNSVSMINLVMAIGFAVDYSAHIAHAYITSNKATANERVVDALTTLGASVFMGGFTTFLGMVVLAFAASEIFRIFFRMFFGIVVLGLLHGLCILPVYLSFFCWRPSVITTLSVRDTSSENEEGKAAQNTTNENGSLQLTSLRRMDSTRHVEDALFQSDQHSNFQDDKPASQQRENVAVEIGIQNMGIEEDREEVEMNAKETENKMKQADLNTIHVPGSGVGLLSSAEDPNTQSIDIVTIVSSISTEDLEKDTKGSDRPANQKTEKNGLDIPIQNPGCDVDEHEADVNITETEDNPEKTENSSNNKSANQQTGRDPVAGGIQNKDSEAVRGTVEINLTEGEGLNEDGCSRTEKEPQISSL